MNDTYTAYESGEINATDFASSDPTTIATQATTGYYGLASVQLAAMGLSGNESASHVVNTTENSSERTITGTLFYTGEDNQAFDTGTEYVVGARRIRRVTARFSGEVYIDLDGDSVQGGKNDEQ